VDSFATDADAWHVALRTFLKIAAASCLASCLFAHGGVLLWRKQAGPFVVTLFSAETPIRAGNADLSVMVQKTGDPDAVLDPTVQLIVRKPDTPPIAMQASHSLAANKILYGASIGLPTPGVWNLQILVKSEALTGTVSGTLDVAPAQPPLQEYWPYFAVVPFAILLFALNQWLKRGRAIRS
jgi:hypothetical protein